jgi:cellulose synthase (UDP-forming)
MLFLKNPLFRRGLSLPQRICYINSMSFWLFPLMRLFYLLVPLVYLFFGVEILVATFEEVLAYMLGYLAVSFMVQNALYARFRWPLISEIYEVAQAPYLAHTILRTIWSPRGAKFNVTTKDETLDQDFISPIHWPLTVLFLTMLLGVVALAIRWYVFPGDRSVLAVVGGWAVFNFILVSIAYRAVAEKQQRRVSVRVEMDVPGRIWVPGKRDAFSGVRIINASTSGVSLLLEVGQELPGGTTTELLLHSQIALRPQLIESPHLEARIMGTVCSIKQTSEGLIMGVVFEPDQPVSSRETVAYLIFGDSENWQQVRDATHNPKGLLAGLGYVVWLFLRGTPILLSSLIREPGRQKAAASCNHVQSKPAHLLAFGVDPENRDGIDPDGWVGADLDAQDNAETEDPKPLQASGAS